jgi:serralysin
LEPDNNGNYVSNAFGIVAGTSVVLESAEITFNQDFNGDGSIGLPRSIIRTDTNGFGSTSLAQVGNCYFLYAAGGTSGPGMQYNSAAVTAGEFGAFSPFAAVKTASGYELIWKETGAAEYAAWNLDNNGNYVSNAFGVVAATSVALESAETTFNQDLNGDGVTGLNPIVIQTGTNSFGLVSLAELGNNYFLYAAGGTIGPALQFNGAAVTVGEFGDFSPFAAVKTASGYELIWKEAAAAEYAAWNLDNNGNYVSNAFGIVTATSIALEMAETTFNQDLNGDGVIGLNPIVIQTDTNSFGSTSLAELGNNYFLYAASTTSGPELKYGGAAVTAGEFGDFSPFAAVKTASGYEMIWKEAGASEYGTWNVDNNGNYISNAFGIVAGTSTALESAETTFNQDLNGDGVVGLYAAPGTALQISQALAGASGAATIGAHATLELAAADSASVTFAASTGMLKLDQPSTFSAEISRFHRRRHARRLGSNRSQGHQLQHGPGHLCQRRSDRDRRTRYRSFELQRFLQRRQLQVRKRRKRRHHRLRSAGHGCGRAGGGAAHFKLRRKQHRRGRAPRHLGR